MPSRAETSIATPKYRQEIGKTGNMYEISSKKTKTSWKWDFDLLGDSCTFFLSLVYRFLSQFRLIISPQLMVADHIISPYN